MLLLVVLGAVLVAVQAAPSILVPGPIGPYRVATRVHELVDNSRWDPYSPSYRKHHRRIVVQTFLPLLPRRDSSGQVETLRYMPVKTAEVYGLQASKQTPLREDFFHDFFIEYAKLPGDGQSILCERPTYPVVLFSPGQRAPRTVYAAGARDLASLGYIVITIDHPYDAEVVEFPDGSVVLGANITTTAQIWQAIEVRAADVSFLINQLHDKQVFKALTAEFPGRFDLRKIAMSGHGLGGTTASALMYREKRIIAGIDLDGSIFGRKNKLTFTQPFALVKAQGSPADRTWNWLYDSVRGSKVEVSINNTQRLAFTDLPLLVETAKLKLSEQNRQKLSALLGKLSGRRIQRAVAGTVDAFLRFAFEGNADALRNLAQDQDSVTVVRSDIKR